MDFSARLNLPYLLPNQAQKHVTVNESLRALDVLVQLSVISSSRIDEPSVPVEGDAYILPAGASGETWSALSTGELAAFIDSAWMHLTPQTGWRAFDAELGEIVVFTNGSWVRLAAELPSSALMFGINAEGDATNRLTVKSDAELLSHDDITPGSGDARKIINKLGSTNSASVIFQTGFEPKAEIGLTGTDDLHVKVFDGTDWHDSAIIDRTTAHIGFPNGVSHTATGALHSNLILLPGGDGEVSIYRNDSLRPQNPRTYTISGISGDEVTLSTSDASELFYNAFMQDVCFLRIWNMSRSPQNAAWIEQTLGTNRLKISDASAIADWQPGDTLQLGDPLDVTPNRCIALDISPMMQNQLGAIFP